MRGSIILMIVLFFLGAAFLSGGIVLLTRKNTTSLFQQTVCNSTSIYFSEQGNIVSYSVRKRNSQSSEPQTYNYWCKMEKCIPSFGDGEKSGVFEFMTSDTIHFTGAPRVGPGFPLSVPLPPTYLITTEGPLYELIDANQREPNAFFDWGGMVFTTFGGCIIFLSFSMWCVTVVCRGSSVVV